MKLWQTINRLRKQICRRMLLIPFLVDVSILKSKICAKIDNSFPLPIKYRDDFHSRLMRNCRKEKVRLFRNPFGRKLLALDLDLICECWKDLSDLNAGVFL